MVPLAHSTWPDFPQSPAPSHASLLQVEVDKNTKNSKENEVVVEDGASETEASFHVDGYSSSVNESSARSSSSRISSRASSPCPSSGDLSHSRLHSVPSSPTPSFVVIHPQRHHQYHQLYHHHQQFQQPPSRSPSPQSAAPPLSPSYSPPDTARPPGRARLTRSAWPSHRIDQFTLDLESLEIRPGDFAYGIDSIPKRNNTGPVEHGTEEFNCGDNLQSEQQPSSFVTLQTPPVPHGSTAQAAFKSSFSSSASALTSASPPRRSVIQQRSAPSLSQLVRNVNDNHFSESSSFANSAGLLRPSGKHFNLIGYDQPDQNGDKMKPRASLEGLRESVDQLFSINNTLTTFHFIDRNESESKLYLNPNSQQQHFGQQLQNSGLGCLRRALSLGSSPSVSSNRVSPHKDSIFSFGSGASRKERKDKDIDLRLGSRIRVKTNARPSLELGLGRKKSDHLYDQDWEGEVEVEEERVTGFSGDKDSNETKIYTTHYHPPLHHHSPLQQPRFLLDEDKKRIDSKGAASSSLSTVLTREQSTVPVPSSFSPSSPPLPSLPQINHHQTQLDRHPLGYSTFSDDPQSYRSRPTPSGPSSPTTEKSLDECDADIEDFNTYSLPRHHHLNGSFPRTLTYPSPPLHSRHLLADDIDGNNDTIPTESNQLYSQNSARSGQHSSLIVASRRLLPLSFGSSSSTITAQPSELPTLATFGHPDLPEVLYPSSPELIFSTPVSAPTSPPLLSTPCTPEIEKESLGQQTLISKDIKSVAHHQPTLSLSSNPKPTSTSTLISGDDVLVPSVHSALKLPHKVTSNSSTGIQSENYVSVRDILLPPVVLHDQRKSKEFTTLSAPSSLTTSPLTSNLSKEPQRLDLPATISEKIVNTSMSDQVITSTTFFSEAEDSIDPEPPHPQGLIPSAHPFHHHKPRPSVPFSPRSSTQTDSFVPSDLSVVQLNHNSSSRRYSKFSSFTSSSHSSGNSSESNHASTYPSRIVSTVLEEETEGPSNKFDQYPDVHLEFFPFSQTTTTTTTSKEDLHHHRHHHAIDSGDYNPLKSNHSPNLKNTSASSTLVDGSTRSRRAGTISSEHSVRSNRSNQSTHPFAAPTILATPPPFSTSAKNGFLSPQLKRDEFGFAFTRSTPNLADAFNMAAVIPAHQVALVSAEDEDGDDETCPVCCESLSFTFRLPGEKPHIVPECGHALHEECFVTVYGEVPPEGSRRNLGVCGMCRQQMRIGSGGERRGASKSKLAALMGQNGQALQSPITDLKGDFNLVSPKGSEWPRDDPIQSLLGTAASNSSRSLASDSTVKVVIPTIAIHPEYPSIRKTSKGKHVITAMISVTVPQATDRSKYSAQNRGTLDMNFVNTGDGSIASPQFPPSPRSASSYPEASVFSSTRSPLQAPNSATSQTVQTPSSFNHIIADLRNRVVDYKTSGLDTLGPLRLFDLLSVRKGSLIREFNVYLFQEALICLAEEKKPGGLRGIFSSSSSIRTGESSSQSGGRQGVLKLKGRIYVRHMRKVFDSSIPGELSLTITMVDENMESFILIFKDRASHDMWRNNVNRLVEDMHEPGAMAHATQSAKKIAKLTGTTPTVVPIVRPPSLGRSATSPTTNFNGKDRDSPSLTSPASTKAPMVTSTSSLFSSTPSERSAAVELVTQQPLAPKHTPVDLVLVLSLPAPSSSSTLPLKIRLIRSSVQFVLACMGPRDRISLVATELGPKGVIRRTPFLNATNPDSRAKLETFVNDMGSGKKDDDEFEVAMGKDEKPDVVTAVNVALDVVLQRKAKNPLTGMILISDTSDVIRRAQMDLVTARLDAANIPVHSLGYGKSHDPSPLWMMSNHTNGTYTFIKEWYHLRDALAGVVGGIMSIALTNMKLHVSCQDHDVRVVKVSGTTQAIVAATGKDVDIELHELMHGERREILIDLELEDDGPQRLSTDGSTESCATPDSTLQQPPRSSSLRKSPSLALGAAFDSLMAQGTDILRGDVYADSLIDEIPLADVDCSFHDPSAGRSVARLAHPVLLTLPILPSTAPQSSLSAEPTIVRRRMELLASDMITRALLIASRKNFGHATKMLRETKRIIESVADGMRSAIIFSSTSSSLGAGERSRREVQTLMAVEGLAATVQDVDMLLDGLEVNKDMFERDHRNYAAQQAIILRSQKSWTVRTPTEMQYATKDVQAMIQLSGEYTART